MTFAMSRRAFMALLAALPSVPVGAALDPVDPERRLRQAVAAAVDGQPVGLVLRRISLADGSVSLCIDHQADALYPAASSFKVMAVLFYLLSVPHDRWVLDDEAAAFRVAVYSDNRRTGDLLAEAAAYTEYGAGDAIRAFNAFLRAALGLENGLTQWDWPGSGTQGQQDPAFLPSDDRSVLRDERRYPMPNLFSARDLATTWASLLQPDAFAAWPSGAEAARAALWLFSLPGDDYRSPMERVWGEYVGKDGVLPGVDSPAGRAVSDAGIVRVGQSGYVLAVMSLASEYRLMQILADVAAALDLYEWTMERESGNA